MIRSILGRRLSCEPRVHFVLAGAYILGIPAAFWSIERCLIALGVGA
jgi:hypothetical protein